MSPNNLLFRTALAAMSICTGFLTAMPAYADRQVLSLPHRENFDSSAYQNDIVFVEQGAVHTWMPSGGFQGGAAKFTPTVAARGMSGLGRFDLTRLSPVPAQINVRFMIWHGATWSQFGAENKLVILDRIGNSVRPTITAKHVGTGATRWESWGACDGTACHYKGGGFVPDLRDSLRIGNPPDAREGEWISVEVEANTTTKKINLYVATKDGSVEGLYATHDLVDGGPAGVWSYIQAIGGYMDEGVPAHPDNFILIDDLVISSTFIGPPTGFVIKTPKAPVQISIK
jgi:hypothetical protein